jgi:hypothetical protein
MPSTCRGSQPATIALPTLDAASERGARTPTPKWKPDADRRRALALLAGAPDGCTEPLLVAHGLAVELLADIVRAGLTTAKGASACRAAIWSAGFRKCPAPGNLAPFGPNIWLPSCQQPLQLFQICKLGTNVFEMVRGDLADFAT